MSENTEEENEQEKPIKPEWKVFCNEYVIDWNGTRAYMVAYPNSTENSAGANAVRLIGNDRIAKHIEEIQKDLAKLCGVSAARNINELKKIAYSNMANFKNGWMDEKDFDQLTEDEKAALSEIQHTTTHTINGSSTIVKFKVHDKQRAIEIMNRMLGYNSPDKVDLSTLGESINPIHWVNE